jgi:hypothetical protein
MPTRSEAEEHLRIIRSLMEKATIYRAISAPTALVGGTLSILAAGAQHFLFPRPTNGDELMRLVPWFGGIWFAVLVLTLTANTYFLWRGARDRNAPFLSSGMRLALRATLPGLLCGLYFTIMFGVSGPLGPAGYGMFYLPPLWMLFYALGLLATFHFSPRSITRLGWAFLAAGMASFYLVITEKLLPLLAHGNNLMTGTPVAANALMAATFGLFHLIYAACTWPRRTSASDTGGTP